ncbi:MAG: phosphoglucosamine mutase, partial [Rhodocyclales bacterium]|nr:phosphoglucosamine mutase [Rhodocyclales bacterium]
ELGADVVPVGVEPSGRNINDGVGATVPTNLSAAVLSSGADLGISLDGDADRLMMCDSNGAIYDGDKLLYVIAKAQHALGQLDGVVGTLMSNLGFEHAIERLNVPFHRAKVGDRYVLEMMAEKGCKLGGENSGHIICLDRHTTGDGIVSALQVLASLRQTGQTLAQVCSDMTFYPQRLINVRMAAGFDWAGNASIQSAHASAVEELGDAGRVLLRPSGTEPLLRVMVEGSEADMVERLARSIADAISQAVA